MEHDSSSDSDGIRPDSSIESRGSLHIFGGFLQQNSIGTLTGSGNSGIAHHPFPMLVI